MSDTTAELNSTAELNAIGRRILEEVFGPTPRHRYFQKRNGPMFSWLVEPMDGKYASFVHVPKGRGSRSGNARLWVIVEELTAIHDRRKDAKARALRLYRAVQAGSTIAELKSGAYLDREGSDV